MTTTIPLDEARVSTLRKAVLDWYDQHGRDLPWRIRGEGQADPYRVWLSEVMLQQTTVPHASPYYSKFIELWPTVRDLAGAADEEVMGEWAGLGYYSRARNLIKCARVVVAQYGGTFPTSEAELLKLPGFGPYTAAAVAAFAFGQAANVVDGNVERIMARLYAVETPMPAARQLLRVKAADWVRSDRAADWPQALMDLASLVCRPKSPSCLLCPLQYGCAAYAQGTPEHYPVRMVKTPKPRRFGVAFVLMTDEGFIAERRPNTGLLGGMLGLPHLEWRDETWADTEIPQKLPLEKSYLNAGSYDHVFTHFVLNQTVISMAIKSAELADILRAHNSWQLVPWGNKKALPTAFGKALKLIGK